MAFCPRCAQRMRDLGNLSGTVRQSGHEGSDLVYCSCDNVEVCWDCGVKHVRQIEWTYLPDDPQECKDGPHRTFLTDVNRAAVAAFESV